MSTIQCPNCQAANKAAAVFCAECGHRFAPSSAARFASGVGAKLRGDDLAQAADVRAAQASRPAAQPQPVVAFDELAILTMLGFISLIAGIATFFALVGWRNSIAAPSFGEIAIVPWPAANPGPLAIAVAFNILVVGRIYVSLLRADRAHLRSPN